MTKLYDLDLTQAKPQPLISFLLSGAVSLLMSCQDFSQFNCFNESNGCLSEDEVEMTAMSGGDISVAGEERLPFPGGTGEIPAGEMPAGETPAGETPAGETPAGEITAGETLAGETPVGETPAGETPAGETPAGETPAGEMLAGEMLAGEMLAGEMLAGEMLAGDIPPPVLRPSWCISETEYYTEGYREGEVALLWECVQGPNQAFYQVTVGEVPISYALHVINDLDLCESNFSSSSLCTEDYIERLIGIFFPGDFADSGSENVETMRELVLSLPVAYISPSQVTQLLSQMNQNTSDGQGPQPHYRLMSLAEWRSIRGDSQETDYGCDSNFIRGVFQGEGVDYDGRSRCAHQRPRAINRDVNRAQRCKEHNANGEDRSFEIPALDLNFSGARGPILCDVHGNMREILTDCNAQGDYCVLGGGFSEFPITQVSDQPEQALPINSNISGRDIGFRLVRTFNP